MNILPSIVDGYMFNEMSNVLEDTKTMTGGYPLTRMVETAEFITQSGGGAHRETPLLARLENLAIPIGLVYRPHVSSSKLKYEDSSLLDDGIVDNILYDKLVDMVSFRKNNNTRKQQSHTEGRKKTIRIYK